MIHNITKFGLGSAMALALASPGYARASDDSASDGQAKTSSAEGSDVSTQAQSAGEIVVTAQKRSETVREVPATLIVRDSAALFEAGVREPTDLSVAFPGLTYSNANASAQPAIRGISTAAAGGTVEPPVAVYIDGVYQPSQVANNSFSMAFADNVQVLKGPQGTIFGRNVVGGAVIVTTRNPSLSDFEGEARVTLSNFNGGSSRSAFAHEENLFISVPVVQDKLAVSFAGTYAHNNGFIRDLTPGSDGRYGEFERVNIQGKILWEPTSDISVLFSARYSDQTREVGPTIRSGVSRSLTFADGIVGTDPWTFAHDSEAMTKSTSEAYSLKADFDTDIGTFTSVSAYQKFDNPSVTDNDGGYSPSCRAAFRCIDLNFNFALPEVISQEFVYASEKWGGFSMIAGVFGFSKKNETYVNLFGTNPATLRSLTKNLSHSFAGFGEVTYELTDQLSVIAGLRYTYDSEESTGTNSFALPDADPLNINSSATTTRFGLKYRPTESLNLYATFSQGYQAGVTTNSNWNNGGAISDPVDPQYLDAYEAGVKFSQPGLSMNLAGFFYKYDDIVVQRYTGITIESQNAAAAEVFGVDFDMNVSLPEGFGIAGGFSWLPKSKYTKFPDASLTIADPANNTANQLIVDLTGERLIRSPKLTIALGLTYEAYVAGGDLNLSANYYHSSRYETQLGTENGQKSYDTFGLTAKYRPGSGPFAVSVYGRNITNKAYVTGTVASANAYLDYYAPPREIGVTLGYSF